jgi:hypothetical protein
LAWKPTPQRNCARHQQRALRASDGLQSSADRAHRARRVLLAVRLWLQLPSVAHSGRAWVVNGNGQNRDDDNNNKDIIARLAITVPAEYNSILRELRVGASYYRGRKLLTDATTGNYIVGGRRDRYGADFYYNHWPLGLTYEYVRTRDGPFG